MNRVKRRTMSLLSLVLIIAMGLSFYVYRYAVHGREWASFTSNKAVFSQGQLMVGTVCDRNGAVLATVDDGRRIYNEDPVIRRSTLHAVGDQYGNIGTGALSVFAPELIGYDPVNGAYTPDRKGGKVRLSIDSGLNAAAYEAMDGRKGVVAVENYETGEIVCMLSSYNYDPYYPPEDVSTPEYEGVYLNRFLSAAYTPGSTFKLVTLTAALERIPDLFDRTFECRGSVEIDGEYVTCTGTHGEIDINEALAVSCNCVFAELAVELGGDTLERYANDLGLTGSIKVSGIKTASGNYDKAADGSVDLAWSGIGQYNDSVNPAAMLRFVSGIANGGTAEEQTLLYGKSSGSDRIMKTSTAETIAKMMNYNVYYTYGEDNYPGLELCAKSGTAEVGGGADPHALFVGFIRDEKHPYAFVVIVENGGSGSRTAGRVANAVLQAAVNK
ncbi:MAG: penicillin-binding protein [Oscillospiraceae bacterium]|nr:penicillin-binding protein [Oscillospiraceae bacterium]